MTLESDSSREYESFCTNGEDPAFEVDEISDAEESEEVDEEQVYLLNRLQSIDKCVSDFEALLAFATETQKQHSRHLEHCNSVRQDLAEGTKSTESSTSSKLTFKYAKVFQTLYVDR
jgi:hypothetical protein